MAVTLSAGAVSRGSVRAHARLWRRPSAHLDRNARDVSSGSSVLRMVT